MDHVIIHVHTEKSVNFCTYVKCKLDWLGFHHKFHGLLHEIDY